MNKLSPAKIKTARLALGLTQEQLAERLGWQRQAFARIELSWSPKMSHFGRLG